MNKTGYGLIKVLRRPEVISTGQGWLVKWKAWKFFLLRHDSNGTWARCFTHLTDTLTPLINIKKGTWGSLKYNKIFKKRYTRGVDDTLLTLATGNGKSPKYSGDFPFFRRSRASEMFESLGTFPNALHPQRLPSIRDEIRQSAVHYAVRGTCRVRHWAASVRPSERH